jgi:hypothetical protein
MDWVVWRDGSAESSASAEAIGRAGTRSARIVIARTPTPVATITTFLGLGLVFFSTGFDQASTRLEFCTTFLQKGFLQKGFLQKGFLQTALPRVADATPS